MNVDLSFTTSFIFAYRSPWVWVKVEGTKGGAAEPRDKQGVTSGESRLFVDSYSLRASYGNPTVLSFYIITRGVGVSPS